MKCTIHTHYIDARENSSNLPQIILHFNSVPIETIKIKL